MVSVFISYTRVDQQFGHWLYEILEQQGYSPLLPPDDPPPNDQWVEQIGRAIERCAVFISVITPHSFDSPDHKRQCDYANRHHKLIVPVICRPTPIPEALLCFRAIDLTLQDEQGLEELSRQLFTLSAPGLQKAHQQIMRMLSAPPRMNDTSSERQLGKFLRDKLRQKGYLPERHDQVLSEHADISVELARCLFRGVIPAQDIDDPLLNDLAKAVGCSATALRQILGRTSDSASTSS